MGRSSLGGIIVSQQLQHLKDIYKRIFDNKNWIKMTKWGPIVHIIGWRVVVAHHRKNRMIQGGFFNWSAQFSVPKWKNLLSQRGAFLHWIFREKLVLVGCNLFFILVLKNGADQLKKTTLYKQIQILIKFSQSIQGDAFKIHIRQKNPQVGRRYPNSAKKNRGIFGSKELFLCCAIVGPFYALFDSSLNPI